MNIIVYSSFIKAVRYDEAKQILRVHIGNHYYYYYGVSLQKIYRFRKAESKGQYFCAYIKGHYESTKRRTNK